MREMKTDKEQHEAFEWFLGDVNPEHMTPKLWAYLIKTFEKEGTADTPIGRFPASMQILRRLGTVSADWVQEFIAAGAFLYRMSEQSFRDAAINPTRPPASAQ